MVSHFDSFLRTHRPLCVAYELARFVWYKINPFQTRTPVWYGFDGKPIDTFCESLPLTQNWYHISRPLYRHEHVFYNLQNALRVNPNVKGFAFVFFMGIGDYLYTTPLWGELKKQFPTVPFYAYVGAQFDRNNSPLVGKLLQENPHFEKVYFFEGARHPLIWQNYDYTNVFTQLPDGFLVIPVYYQYGTTVVHRVHSLFETFGLPIPKKPLTPQMYFPQQPADIVQTYLKRALAGAQGKKGAIFLQLDSRGSNYTYPHLEELVNLLTQEGYFVLSVTKGGPLQNPLYMEVNIKELAINQTWQFLALLKQQVPLYVIAVNSVFWAASAGLNLPNLGLQHWVDKKVHNLWYDNIEVLTNHRYPLLPADKQIIAPPESYTPHNRKIVDYKPAWIVKWFKQKFEKPL